LKKLRKPWIALAIVAAVLALAAYVTRPREPVYMGKRLSEWLLNHDHNNEDALKEAMKATGTNALPLLMEMLDAKDSRVELWLKRVARRQNFIEWEPTLASERNIIALFALSALGASAQPALPKMRELFLSDAPGGEQACASAAIADCDPDAFSFFTACLTNANTRVRHLSAMRLGNMRGQARVAVPQLIVALDDPDLSVRAHAARALGLIDYESDETLSLLISRLESSDDRVRVYTASGITSFGPRAHAAVEQLRQMTKDTNQTVRRSATNALRQIIGADFERTTPEAPR
jgi:HEAT repeat protein